MRAINLKTNHLTAPVGIDAGPLFLSWQCADGVRQTAYEIQLTANGEMLCTAARRKAPPCTLTFRRWAAPA